MRTRHIISSWWRITSKIVVHTEETMLNIAGSKLFFKIFEMKMPEVV